LERLGYFGVGILKVYWRYTDGTNGTGTLADGYADADRRSGLNRAIERGQKIWARLGGILRKHFPHLRFAWSFGGIIVRFLAAGFCKRRFPFYIFIFVFDSSRLFTPQSPFVVVQPKSQKDENRQQFGALRFSS